MSTDLASIAAALASELRADLSAEHAALVVAPATGIEVDLGLLRAEAPVQVAEAAAALEAGLVGLVVALRPADLGARLTLGWEDRLARRHLSAVALDNLERAAELLDLWRADVEFWSAVDPDAADEWTLLDAVVEPGALVARDVVTRLRKRGDDGLAALLRIASDRERALLPRRVAKAPVVAVTERAVATPPSTAADAQPAPAVVLEAASTETTPTPPTAVVRAAPEIPAELATAWKLLMEHGMIDVTTLDRVVNHTRWSRLFAREVAGWATEAGARVVATVSPAGRVWRLADGSKT